MTADGRIEPPEVTYGDERVIIAIRVRPRGGDVECPSNPGTPLTVRLKEPVGTRAAVDGAALPPVTVVEPRQVPLSTPLRAVTDVMPNAAMVTSPVVMTTVVSWRGAGAAGGRCYVELTEPSETLRWVRSVEARG